MEADRVITSPPTGERIRWLVTEDESGGELLRFDYFLAPGKLWPGARLRHVHPVQEERFEVVSGTPEFSVRGRKRRAQAGEVVVVPPATPHRFRNVGPDELHLIAELRPALRGRQLFETFFRIGREGRAAFSTIPRNPLLGVYVADEFADEVIVGPTRVMRPLLRGGARLVERLRLHERYRDYIGG